MIEERVSNFKKEIEEIRLAVDEKTVVHLELDKCERIVDRLGAFSEECQICLEHFNMLEEQLTTLREQHEKFSKEEIKKHNKKVQEVSIHLQKQHELIGDNYYMSIYMSIGLGVGLFFGLVFFDNIAVGLPIGMLLGMSVGMAKDKEAKKQGRVI